MHTIIYMHQIHVQQNIFKNSSTTHNCCGHRKQHFFCLASSVVRVQIQYIDIWPRQYLASSVRVQIQYIDIWPRQ